MQEYIDLDKRGRGLGRVLYQNDVMELLLRLILMKGNEVVIFCSCESGGHNKEKLEIIT